MWVGGWVGGRAICVHIMKMHICMGAKEDKLCNGKFIRKMHLSSHVNLFIAFALSVTVSISFLILFLFFSFFFSFLWAVRANSGLFSFVDFDVEKPGWKEKNNSFATGWILIKRTILTLFLLFQYLLRSQCTHRARTDKNWTKGYFIVILLYTDLYLGQSLLFLSFISILVLMFYSCIFATVDTVSSIIFIFIIYHFILTFFNSIFII